MKSWNFEENQKLDYCRNSTQIIEITKKESE